MSGIFEDCVFCITGRLEYGTRRDVEKLVKDEGALCRGSVSRNTTHLVCAEDAYSGGTSKVEKARDNGVFIVKEDWIHDSIGAGTLKDVEDYLWEPLDQEDEEEEKPKKKTRKKKKKEKESDGSLKRKKTKTEKYEPGKKKRKVLKKVIQGKPTSIPTPHEMSGFQDTGEIYVDGEEIYNCVLNQTNIGRNNNKFYEIQLIEADGKFHMFTHWGRIGETGRKGIKSFSDADDAIAAFKKQFRTKTGNKWEDRDDFVVKNKKYTMIAISYDDENDVEEEIVEDDKSLVKCDLDPSIQDFIRRISDVKSLNMQLKEFDIDTRKMPLGKLSEEQINTGMSILKDIEEIIRGDDWDEEELESLCNEFYTNIPQIFGRNRPPLIDNLVLLKDKMDMIDSLQNMTVASRIIEETKENTEVHPITSNYNKLECDLIPLDKKSEDYKDIQKYLKLTHGPTHSHYKLKIKYIFKVNRKGEEERYNKSYGDLDNKQLLWHGSRMTNFMGILSQGLRIAPPSAPVTGYMFGKGIYFADMVSKSANYCHTSLSNNVGCVLLAECALGKQYKLNDSEYNIDKKILKRKGYDSTWGLGREWVPDSKTHFYKGDVKWPIGKASHPKDVDSSLLYNEFIVYDVKQVVVRYAVILDFDYID